VQIAWMVKYYTWNSRSAGSPSAGVMCADETLMSNEMVM